jgi:hypothetical protein
MNELKNKKLNMKLYGLGMLVILAFGTMILPVKSYALVYGMTCSAVGCNYNYQTAPSIDIPAPIPVVRQPITPIVYQAPVVKTVTPVKNYGSVLGASTTKLPECVNTVATSTITANTVDTPNSFIPSGIVAWILIAILVLTIVILVRKIFGGEKNYHSTTLKQA